jgi:two-component system chemotaxis sensor kinase CheA
LNDIRQKLLGIFQIEQKEHVERMRSLLARLDPVAGPRPELEEAFRRAHSLKGAARAVDLRQVETLAHRLETLFARVREGALTPDLPVVEVIHQVLDAIEDAVAGVREKPDAAGEPRQALRAIDALLGLEPEPAAEPEPSTEPEAPPGALSSEASGMPPAAPDTVRVRTETLDRLLASAGQLTTETLYQDRLIGQLRALRRSIAGMEKEWDRLREVAALPLRRIAALPEFSRVGRYLDGLDTQWRALSSQARALGQSQRHNSWSLRHLSEQLQEQVKRARMAPAESVFEGFRRMVRDIARDEGKQVEFHCTGMEVEADRMVLQALKDPLMHLLRNAACHGIETPEERSRAAKKPAGTVTLRLETRGNLLLAAVEDDGRGIDLEAVLRVALQKRFLSEAEARSRSPDELARLIFRAGFSTSPAVTDLSGRGMGLSVVDEQVRRLHGDVDLRFRGRTGTCITLLVPLTVSSQRFVLVGCCGQQLAVPAHSIERLCRVATREIETVEGKAVFSYQGRPVPLTTLEDMLGLASRPESPRGRWLPVMVLRSGDARLGVAVDAFLALRDAIVRELGLKPEHAGKSAGGILLDDGTVAVVLNAADLVAAAADSQARPARFVVAPAQEKKPPVILVVDDSITTRSLEKTILESHGYRVRVAVDGVEALAQLRTEKADLVITDIQMPRMDGYALLEEIKKDKQLAGIPVIVVTSMERREEQERGLLLGADAYVVKRKFDQQELLQAIRQII